MSYKTVIATGNSGKVREFEALLADFPIQIVPQSEFNLPEAAETGSTFVENAIIKARHAAKLTGLPAIADDSGLAVDALDGQPGVYSSRYAGENASDSDNVNKLLGALQGVEASRRSARFLCVIVYMRSADDPTPLICQGEWQGAISEQAYGHGGFGYDPVFWLDSYAKTAAQLPVEVKNSISHRAFAMKLLMEKLSTKFNEQTI